MAEHGLQDRQTSDKGQTAIEVVRNSLAAKLKQTGLYYNSALELLAHALAVYPATPENVYTVGNGVAAALLHEALEIRGVVAHLDPGKGSNRSEVNHG